MSGTSSSSGSLMKNLRDGAKVGVTMYAWWKDGVQYVCTGGRTLKQAIDDIDRGKYDEELIHMNSFNKDN